MPSKNGCFNFHARRKKSGLLRNHEECGDDEAHDGHERRADDARGGWSGRQDVLVDDGIAGVLLLSLDAFGIRGGARKRKRLTRDESSLFRQDPCRNKIARLFR